MTARTTATAGTVNGIAVTGQACNQSQRSLRSVTPDLYRPYQGFGTITYSRRPGQLDLQRAAGLRAAARRRLSLSLAYTWSHSIDDSSDRYDGNFVNSYDLERTRASSNFDQRHLLNIGYVYDLPVLHAAAGFCTQTLGGWQISGISHFPNRHAVQRHQRCIGDNAGVGNGVGTGSYLDVSWEPQCHPVGDSGTGILGPLLYNPAAFADPTGLTFGTAGRNILNNPRAPIWIWACSSTSRSPKLVLSSSAPKVTTSSTTPSGMESTVVLPAMRDRTTQRATQVASRRKRFCTHRSAQPADTATRDEVPFLNRT